MQLKEVIMNESEATISDLATGTAVKITVASRNIGAGESSPNDPGPARVP